MVAWDKRGVRGLYVRMEVVFEWRLVCRIWCRIVGAIKSGNFGYATSLTLPVTSIAMGRRGEQSLAHLEREDVVGVCGYFCQVSKVGEVGRRIGH